MVQLTSSLRRALKARAHHLKPVVRVGQKGITESLIAETDQALAAHALIKVHIACDDRNERQHLAERIAESTGALIVGHIGKIAILYRPEDETQ